MRKSQNLSSFIVSFRQICATWIGICYAANGYCGFRRESKALESPGPSRRGPGLLIRLAKFAKSQIVQRFEMKLDW